MILTVFGFLFIYLFIYSFIYFSLVNHYFIFGTWMNKQNRENTKYIIEHIVAFMVNFKSELTKEPNS